MGRAGRGRHALFTGLGGLIMKTAKHFTMPELVNKPVNSIGAWATKDTAKAGARSRRASGSTQKAKALLRRLDREKEQP